jgi:hypothetical protein
VSEVAASPPSGNAIAHRPSIRARARRGRNSYSIAVSTGTNPPMPTPTPNRSRTSWAGPWASAHSALNAVKTATVSWNAGRRPIRSDTQPQSKDPHSIPAIAADAITPTVRGERAHSRSSTGEMSDIICRSRESKNAPAAQTANTSQCLRVSTAVHRVEPDRTDPGGQVDLRVRAVGFAHPGEQGVQGRAIGDRPPARVAPGDPLVPQRRRGFGDRCVRRSAAAAAHRTRGARPDPDHHPHAAAGGGRPQLRDVQEQKDNCEKVVLKP